ncbi:phage/plasmid primase, P4 family [Acidithiobacillus sp. IBUN Pt1247-S3]|uniref:DNA primase family protein n=1 Tax=Acidithiobacillus sp. IBUN Pt1247-S3 TaxID=3166642 RepID=UPI0034E476F4
MAVVNFPTSEPKKPAKPDHVQIAEYLSPDGDLIYAQDQFWRFDPVGIWKPYHDEQVKRDLQLIHRNLHIGAKAGDINGAASMAKGVYYRDVEWDKSDQRAVCASNGVLTYQGGEWRLTPYRKEDYRRIRLPVVYDQKATCPRFTQFVQEVFAGADDAKERIRALVEMIGLTLTATTEFEKAALLVGSGANGKSVTLRLLGDMLGDYVSGVNPQEMDNRFQRASLDGKLANIVTELPEGTTLPDGAIKAIISGEACTVEHKHKNPFLMTPRVKIWIGTNHMPGTRDFSPALFRRFLILKFQNVFNDKTKDTRLSEKLRAEISGILNACLGALGSVFDRGELTIPPSSHEAVQDWKRDADQVLTFLEEEMLKEPGAKISSADAYAKYQQWAIGAGIQRPVSRKALTQRIEALGWGTPGKAGSQGQRVIWGIRERQMGDMP